MSGMLTVNAALADTAFEIGPARPIKVLAMPQDGDVKGPYFLVGDPIVQVATHPAGLDAVELIWEVNDLRSYDGHRCRSATAAFTPHGQKEFLKDKFFEIPAGTDGKTFTRIAAVKGPANRYLHRPVRTGQVHYYRIRAYDKAGNLMAESPVTMGAAGPNLVPRPDTRSCRWGPSSTERSRKARMTPSPRRMRSWVWKAPGRTPTENGSSSSIPCG